jgi:hypothetical protein
VSIASPLMQPSPNGRRVGIRIVTFEACSGFTHVTARRIAQPPTATFVTRLRPFRLPGRAARQLPDQSTILWVASSSTGDSRLQGALPIPDLDLCSTLRVPHCRSMRYGPHCRQGPVPSQASSSRMLAELLFRFQGMNRHALRKNYVHRLSAGRASHRLPHLESIYRRRLASRAGCMTPLTRLFGARCPSRPCKSN